MIYLQDVDVTIHQGDALDVLRTLPDASVDCCVTSPPYLGLRDYGHPEQIGLEPTIGEYVAALVAVFEEVRRVLKPAGMLWLNLGDSYSHGGNGSRDPERWPKQSRNDHRVEHPTAREGKPKDLMGIPWRVAFALQDAGWYLRSDIIWAKPNPMPDSVTDRPTKAHEYVFLLSKSPRYFFDQEAVREPYEPDSARRAELYGNNPSNAKWNPNRNDGGRGGSMGFSKPRGVGPDGRKQTRVVAGDGSLQHRDGERWPNGGRNVRSVWEIATQPMSDRVRSVRRRRVEPDAGVDGMKRTTSPDCPVHGDHSAPAPTESDGGRVDDSPSRSADSAGHRAPAQLAEHASTGPPLVQDSALDSSDSLAPGRSPAATSRSTGSRRTARDPATTEPCTPSAGTSSRTGDTSASPASSAPDPDMPASSILQDDSPARPSAGTPGHSDCTCEWYVESTTDTSHFAAYPEELVRRCILAGTSERGVCPVCGAPWIRKMDGGHNPYPGSSTDHTQDGKMSCGAQTHPSGASAGTIMARRHYERTPPKTIGWGPTCSHFAADHEGHANALTPIPATVLDPFFGSGTTGLVARKHGRHCIGIELNADYCELASRRLAQQSLLAVGAG